MAMILLAGCLPLLQHCFLKFAIDWVPLFGRIYNMGLYSKMLIDLYLFAGHIFIVNWQRQRDFELFAYLLSGFFIISVLTSFVPYFKDKPVFLNFFRSANPTPIAELEVDEKGQVKRYVNMSLNTFKAQAMLMTIMAIFTVDFPMFFDRPLCKTEDFGWGLMDLGVSAVVFSSALVNKLNVSNLANRTSFVQDISRAFFGNIVVTGIALLRFFMLTDLNYHDHVTEWGTHWNFFCTIICINFLMSFVRSNKISLIIGLVVLLAFELYFKANGRAMYILYGPRDDLMSANKEGVYSVHGYFIICLFGIAVGSDIFNTLIFVEPSKYVQVIKTKEGQEKRRSQECLMTFKLFGYSILMFLASELSIQLFDLPSRRLCNIAWIFHQISLCNMMLG